MSMIILGILALLIAVLLGKALSSYIRFEKLCRLVAVAEAAMSELNSTEGLDGNSSNPFRRAQFSRIMRDFFVGYSHPEIALMAAQIRKDMIVIYWMFGLFCTLILALLFLAKRVEQA